MYMSGGETHMYMYMYVCTCTASYMAYQMLSSTYMYMYMLLCKLYNFMVLIIHHVHLQVHMLVVA